MSVKLESIYNNFASGKCAKQCRLTAIFYAQFISGTYKCIQSLYHFPAFINFPWLKWYRSLKYFPVNDKDTYLVGFIVDVMTVNGLATHEAKVSADMVTTKFPGNIPASAPGYLIKSMCGAHLLPEQVLAF